MTRPETFARRPTRTTVRAIAVFFATLVFAWGSRANAEPPSAELMAKLAAYAKTFERMRTHASYSISGQLEQLDGDGQPTSVKRMTAHVEADGGEPKFVIDQYSEDGEDKTAEAREKEDARRRDRKKQAKRKIAIPTLAEEQARYRFDIVETDAADPSRVKISFVPKEASEQSIEGTAWVDSKTGAVLSAGFKFSKTSMFVDFVHVKVRFGAETPLGPAVSSVEFEGKGGILFLRKHFRGFANLRSYRLVP